MKRIVFKLKNKDRSFNQDQRLFLEGYIDSPDNWKGIKQDFISLKLVKVAENTIEVDVEDTGDRWRKHFSRKLLIRGKLEELCVIHGTGINKRGYVSRGLFDVEVISN